MHTSDIAPLVVATEQRKEHYMSKAVLGLSITQIIIGAICFMLQLVLFALQSPIYYVGQGIWTGVFFCLTGIFGIVSSKTRTSCYIVTFLVLTIASTVLTLGIIAASSIEMIISIFYIYDFEGRLSKANVTGINAALIFMAVFQMVVAIISAALSCHGLCGGNQNQVVVAGQVQYVQGPDGQQQMVMQPFPQQGAGLPGGPGYNPVQIQLPAYNQTPPPMVIVK